MKLSKKWIVLGLAALLLAGAVARALSARASAKAALQAQQASAAAEPTVQLAATDVLAVQGLELQQVLPLTGALKAVNSAFVKARAAGELQGLVVREGDTVRAGQMLGQVEATENQARLRQAEQQAEAARAQVDIAQRTLDNNQSLVTQGFISRTALDTSQNSLAAAQASYRAAQAGADLARKALEDTQLRAPIAGQVAQRLAQNGERVAIDARVLEIVDLGALELEASLAASDSVRVRPGQRATLQVEGLAEPLPARVARINPSTVAGSRAVLVYLALEPRAGLRQGLFAQGSLAIGAARVLAVPVDAVRTDQPRPYVQLLQDGRVHRQDVTLGLRGEQGGRSLVEVQGLAEGAQLLSGAVGPLREGTRVARPAGQS